MAETPQPSTVSPSPGTSDEKPVKQTDVTDMTTSALKRGPPRDELFLSGLSEQFLRQLADELGQEWEALATRLGIRSQELYKIKKSNFEDVDGQIFSMLVKWKQRCGADTKGAVRLLVDSLKVVGRLDLAEDLEAQEIKKMRRSVLDTPDSAP